ncbi:LysR family transcriptional regulator [Pseudoduganella namucuonensis]|uniref:Transcriptional regulator, LysR family n=1 Tax=Pseudoduganella namucuonensis TaxID=1035707 RepID=A0A1I7LV18_9BURK|nr:LysR family transcriptional regulator [Pseudoduganella namucuonensis]SFV13563.1 transcriptional regulator, LysR family [Pseudoduganella namucuonensis]
MDQFRTMQIFKAVAEAKSFTLAAEQLDLPRSTVTNAVQAIEQQLGVRLLQRTTRKVSLTVEGMVYLDRCAALLNDLEDLNGLFHGSGRPPGGTVRVDLPERLAHRVVIPALPDFLRRYPDIDVRLGANDRFADLVGEGIDCAVRVGALRDSSLIARRMGDMEQANLASRAYLERHGRPRTLEDLQRHVAVSYFSSQAGRDLPWEYLDEDGAPRTLAMPSRVSVTSTEAYLASCRAGLGLIQAPRAGLEELLASGELEEVLPRWRPAPLPVSIIYSHNRHLSPRVRVFVDWLAEVMRLA